MTNAIEFTKEIFIEASPETVFPYLTEQDKAAQWFGEIVEMEPQAGGRFHVAAKSGVHATGEFKEVTPFEKVVFTWGGMHGIPDGGTNVEILLKQENSGTRLTLRHYDIETQESADDFAEGWEHHAFPLLKLVAEGGSTPERCFRGGSDCADKAGEAA